jgi:mono/diheme cytochrome c family protein
MKRCMMILMLAAAACRTATVSGGNPYAARADAAQAGGKLFRAHCAECHGPAGRGGERAPSLQSPSVSSRSDGALFGFITNGDLRRGMPSWSRLTEERRWQIVTYLRSLEPQPAAARMR